MREWSERHDALLIVDEIQSGFGRTGKLFGYEYYGVEPDLIMCGKGISGSMPLSGSELRWRPIWDQIVGHTCIKLHFYPRRIHFQTKWMPFFDSMDDFTSDMVLFYFLRFGSE